MVKSFWDESGIHGDDVVVLAGFSGGSNQWRSFDRKWRQILDREGVQEFHAREFWAHAKGERVGVYRGWTDERASGFLDDLVDVVRNVDVYPIGCLVVIDAWNNLSMDEQRYLTGARWIRKSQTIQESGVPTEPYFHCFQCCVFDAAKYCNPGIRMNAVFDRNEHLYGYSRTLWNLLKETRTLFNRSLGEISFADSHDAPGVQLADLFAYRSRRYALKKMRDSNASPGSLLERLLVRLNSEPDFRFLNDFSTALERFPAYLESSPGHGSESFGGK
ncbi:MAG: DUF3800 domain-containing protein [Candidatus Acidiferrales bacterium]